MQNKLIVGLLCFFSFTKAQTPEQLEELGYLLEDALLISERFIIPATDAAVYQSTSGWITTAQKRKPWQVNIGLHGNVFRVPNADRTYSLKENELQFLSIENGSDALTLPTALGNDNNYVLVGNLGGQQVRLKTPKGVNQEIIAYPYLNTSVSLPYGFEITGRFSPKTNLKKGYYQVYGLGLKHNVSQYFSALEKNNFYIAVLSAYSKENVNFDFLDVNTAYGNLGINQIDSFVDTFHFQATGAKKIKNVEILGSIIANSSTFNYIIGGPKGSIEEIIPAQDIVNQLIDTIEERKVNVVGEIAANYSYKKFNFTSAFAFGKFVNLNVGVQYNIGL
jgi:hypothetical protein